ncbi:MAG: HEAT repeat domain-containing protein [Anaerolineae bacterium]
MNNLEPLLEKLRSGSPILQRVALSELSMQRDPFTVEPIAAVMRSASRGVQVEAARALVSIGEVSVPALIQFFREDDRELWTLSSASLLMLGQVAVQGLLEAARNESEQEQTLAISVLGQIGDARPVEFLVEALQSDHPAIQTASAIALTRIGPPAVRQMLKLVLQFDKPHLRATTLEIFRQMDVDAFPALMAVIYESSDLERTQAGWVLSEFGEQAVPYLRQGLQHTDKSVRYACVTALGQTRSPEAIPDLTMSLQDTEYVPSMGRMVCDAAYNALKLIGTDEALEAIENWKK